LTTQRENVSDTYQNHPTREETTTLLQSASQGDEAANKQLQPHIYLELKRIARMNRLKERPGFTLSTEGLVHEAYLKLVDQSTATWRDEQHFVALACRAMRQVLTDYARSRNRLKRRGQAVHISISSLDVAEPVTPEYIIALDDAMKALAEYNLNLSQLVELRWFGGMTTQQVADLLGTSLRTAERNWTRAKAFLTAHMTGAMR